ncbi:MAG: hypothetical protein WBH31_11020 [Promethearchaeia archaeon]
MNFYHHDLYHHELENEVRFEVREAWMMSIMNIARNYGHNYSKIAFELVSKMILGEEIKISN